MRPMALLVTGVTPTQLTDPTLPSHYEMMCSVKERLDAWPPARYVGYNSMSFDEPLLQRALEVLAESILCIEQNANTND